MYNGDSGESGMKEDYIMENFEFFTPTRMIFGKNTHQQVGKIVKEYGFKKVLVHFGGSSAKKSGLLDAVTGSLEAEGIQYVTLGGVQANPTLSKAKEGIELCLKEGVDLVLAVGGGSVIDSSKCIADGAGNPDVDVWTYFRQEAVPARALPVGVILTLSASGSEMSASCVITNEENGLIIPNGDISAFTKALFRLMEDNKLWQKLSYKSLQTCKQFDVTTIADKWDILFNELELNKNKYDYTM